METEKYSRQYSFGLILIIISNCCFYTMNHISLYIAISSLGAILILVPDLFLSRLKIQLDPCIIWLTVIYAIFTLNGLLRLQHGTYNWDFMLFTYVLNLALYVAFKKLLQSSDSQKLLFKSIIVATIVILVYLMIVERENLILGGIRIGDTLSGNTNTVGTCLGILSIFFAYALTQHNTNKIILPIFIVLIILMFLTGSKKTLAFLVIDLLIFFSYAKGNKKLAALFGVGFIGAMTLYAIFNVSMLYDVIGYRIEDMLFQVFGIGHGHYSHSTEAREIMIEEGFKIFLNHPIFGGGAGYFASLTTTGYEYSHCNYTELLCNFGLFGTIIFYYPYFNGLFKLKSYNFSLKKVAIFLIIASLVIHWMTVPYSGICIEYIPIIFCFAVISVERKKIISANVEYR